MKDAETDDRPSACRQKEEEAGFFSSPVQLVRENEDFHFLSSFMGVITADLTEWDFGGQCPQL